MVIYDHNLVLVKRDDEHKCNQNLHYLQYLKLITWPINAEYVHILFCWSVSHKRRDKFMALVQLL